MDHLKEVLGFICRWYVLGLACACVPAVVWMGLQAGNADAQASQADLAVSGGLYRQGRDVELVGYYSPASHESCSQVMGGLPGQEVSLAYTIPPLVVQFVVNPAVGNNLVSIKGLPYGPLAFCRTSPRLVVVPKSKPALLIDARVCLAASSGDRRLLKLMIDRQADRACLAIIHGGPGPAAQQADVELRHAGFNLPFIWRSAEKEDWLSTVLSITWALVARPDAVTVVTADAGLARTLLTRGYRVEFIMPGNAADTDVKGKKLRQWVGIEQYVNVASRE
jgi:hypothetical protein